MTSLPTSTALVPVATPRSLPARRAFDVKARERFGELAPVLAGSIVAAALGLAAELVLRAIANRALAAVLSPVQRAAPMVTRTVITEWIVIERIRRLP